ncbi:MAG: competence/damage-inducible protein A [Planctomycetota bacterium]|nr:competence/damage-inducible protein A [Planctomycetota bacterium]
MIAEIVAIGDELLHGGLLDTNSKYIAQEVERRGAVVGRITVVGDDPRQLRDALQEACDRADVVLATGGLGPTLDDRTRDVAAELLAEPLRFDESSWAQILSWFERFRRPCPESNRRQAELPASAVALTNTVGTAPGFSAKIGCATLFAMPGVPREMKVMLREQVLPRLQAIGALTPTAQRMLRVLGPSEAMLGERVGEFMSPGCNPQVGITASGGLLTVRIVATAETVEGASERCEQTAAVLRPRLGDWLFAEGDETLPELALRALAASGRTIAFAESCTGGLCAARLTDCPGSSAVLMGGVVAYSNAAKTAALGVPAALIEQHGAVSEQVAAAMAAGARDRFAAEVAIATTGIAGPAGGSEDKPVGTVCFGLADGNGAEAWTVQIPALGRNFVRDRAVFEVWRALLR